MERVLSREPQRDWEDRLKHSFEDLGASLPGGESSQAAMDRGVQVVHEALKGHGASTAIVTHENLMALIHKYFDKAFGYAEWKKLSNPDVYRLQGDKTQFHFKRCVL